MLFQFNRVVKFRAGPFHLFLAQPINRHIRHDAIDPSVEGGIAPEIADRFPRFHEAILRQVPGVLLAMHHVVNHTKNSHSVAGYQLVEGVGVAGLALFDQLHLRHFGLCRGRFRFHKFGRTGRYFIQRVCLTPAEAASPFATIFAHQANNAVAHLEEPLQKNGVLGRGD